MEKFTINSNVCLTKDITAFYHCDYTNMGAPNNPDYINVVKNDNGGTRTDYKGVHMELSEACSKMKSVFLQDFKSIAHYLGINDLTLCAIPRAKRECLYNSNQLKFKQLIREAANELGFGDGTDYITRIIDTKTTHRSWDTHQTGLWPYQGITKDTCKILSDQIEGKNILLIDDIYTKTINIDEDCLQAILECNPKSLYF